MFKNISSIILIILTLNISIHAQEVTRVDTTIPVIFLTQGYVLESINGAGFTNSTCNYISNISSSNPASISDFMNISLGLSYHFESPLKPAWIADIDHERKQIDLPQSLGLIIPYKMLRIGFGFSQRYNSILDLGKIKVITPENPEGTGEYFTASKTNIVNSYSGLLSYSIDNVIGKDDQLSFGIQYNHNKLDVKEQIFHSYMKATTDDFSWTYGLRYNISDKIQFGLFYEQGSSFREKVKFEGIDSLVQVDIDPSLAGNNYNINSNLITDSYYLEGKIPDKFHLGILYKLNSAMKVTFDITEIYWNQLSENSRNNIDISGSLINHIMKPLSLSVGFLSTDRQYDKEIDVYFSTNDKLYSLFLLGGFNFRFRYVDIDAAYITNALHSGDWRRQHLGKVAIGFYL